MGDCIAVPSGFSPNKDLVNDTFYPILMNLDVQISAFRIYNRWGENIHNETRAWDGMYGGKAQEVGVYVYYLEYTCNGRNETRSGNVTLIR